MMKKLQILALSLSMFIGGQVFAQHAEVAPFVNHGGENPENTNALFDLLFNYNLNSEIGANGNAGVAFINGQYWISAWASNNIHILNADGEFIETITIPGVTGIRSFTSDGTFLYAGAAAFEIFQIDPVTRQLEDVIMITPTSNAKARMVAYDATLDGGNGGFWCADFSSDIASYDMDGTQLSLIPYGNHGHAIYGGAVDHASAGGPYLWVHSQGTSSGQSQVVQLKLPEGTLTGVMYDYNTSGHQPAGNTSIAGGLFISEEAVPGYVAMIGVGQGTPQDMLFGVELVETVGVNDHNLSLFNLYPNPATGVVNIETPAQGEKQVVVYDMLGKVVLDRVVAGKQLDISSLKTGVYMVSISQKGTKVTKKLVVR